MTDGLVITGCDVLLRPRELHPGAGLVVQAGRIVAIGTDHAPPGLPRLDASGLLAVPGLVNAHTHSAENCLRGAGQRLPLEPWLMLMFGVGGEYDAHAHRVCALAGAAEMLRTGTTAVLDHLWMTPPNAGAIDAAFEAYREAGIRAAVAPLMCDADTTPEFAAKLGVDISKAGIPTLPSAELLAILGAAIERWDGVEDGRLRVFAGPGGVQWCSEEFLVGAAELAVSHSTGFHVHLVETKIQAELCRSRFGGSGLQALDRLGILGANVSLPHSVWIDEDDIATIADRGAIVVHNPAANTRLGSGRAPIPALMEAGATVALGADGSASSDNQVMWDEVKLAALIHNDSSSDSWIDGAQALEMATTGGAAALGQRADGLGTLGPGAPADLALLDRRASGLAGALDLEGALAYSEGGNSVRHVFVAGRQVVRDGRCLTIDEQAVFGELAELVEARRTRNEVRPSQIDRAIAQMQDLHLALSRGTSSV
ncbi:MAG: amidohydrolase family protein [Actinobacteria bacterium]|nr:amidohydrolase family protein [Actinomycetota bacterium]